MANNKPRSVVGGKISTPIRQAVSDRQSIQLSTSINFRIKLA
ncbi:MAG: hypothetical protein AB4290_31675 [Spirulina sp.]